MPETTQQTCANCRITRDSRQIATVAGQPVCGPCLETSLFGLVAAPGMRLKLYEYTGTLVVARLACDEIRQEIRANHAARFQAELLIARDPPPAPGESVPVSVGLTLSTYMRDRAQALADEAGMALAAWIRTAITHAFRLTAAPKNRAEKDPNRS